MSEVTAYSYCTVKAQFGPYDSWDTGTISESTTADANVIGPYGGRAHKTMEVHTPTWAAAILDGSEFVSMDIQLSMYVYAAGLSDYLFQVRQNSATVYEQDKSSTTSTSVVTTSGNAAFWGFTGTSQTIISQIKSGSIRFWFAGPYVDPGAYQEHHVKSFAVRITYREPDTKRAALITAMP